jgi:hypothetical protein
MCLSIFLVGMNAGLVWPKSPVFGRYPASLILALANVCFCLVFQYVVLKQFLVWSVEWGDRWHSWLSAFSFVWFKMASLRVNNGWEDEVKGELWETIWRKGRRRETKWKTNGWMKLRIINKTRARSYQDLFPVC